MTVLFVAAGHYLCADDNDHGRAVARLKIHNGRTHIEFTRPQSSIPLDTRLKAVRALLRVGEKGAI